MLARIKRIDWLAIICEGDKFSIGRIMLWVTFGIMIHFWLAGIEHPASLMTTFMVFVSYNLGKKVQYVVEGWIGNGKKVDKGAGEI